MLKYKYYDKKARIQEVWYDSSMFSYSKFIENSDGNYGDFYVTFKGGNTYCYKDVDYSDYMAVVFNGSNGTALNSYIKGKYDFEKKEKLDESELNKLMENRQSQERDAENKKKITYFISGEKDINQNEFSFYYENKLYWILQETPDAYFVVGDDDNVDLMSQNYLLDALNIDPKHIILYHAGEVPKNKNKKITEIVGGFESDEKADEAMTENSTFDAAYLKDIEAINRTAKNILRRFKISPID